MSGERTKEEFLAAVRKADDDANAQDNPKLAVGIMKYADFYGAKYHWTHSAFSWKPEEKHHTSQVAREVPVGFVTDLASVPRVFWAILPPFGSYTQPAVLHDYMYWMQGEIGCTKEDADEVFGHFMTDMGVGGVARATILTAVKKLGQSAWDNNAKLKMAGEKRLLKRFPDDPLITWADWKKDPNNFF